MDKNNSSATSPIPLVDTVLYKKIIICDMNNKEGSAMKLFLEHEGFKNAVFQPDITELKKQVYYYKPDVIVTGNHLWEDIPGINFITRLQLPRHTCVVVCTDNLNEKILSLQFGKPNLHFVKKTNQEKELIETIMKGKKKTE